MNKFIQIAVAPDDTSGPVVFALDDQGVVWRRRISEGKWTRLQGPNEA